MDITTAPPHPPGLRALYRSVGGISRGSLPCLEQHQHQPACLQFAAQVTVWTPSLVLLSLTLRWAWSLGGALLWISTNVTLGFCSRQTNQFRNTHWSTNLIDLDSQTYLEKMMETQIFWRFNAKDTMRTNPSKAQVTDANCGWMTATRILGKEKWEINGLTVHVGPHATSPGVTACAGRTGLHRITES